MASKDDIRELLRENNSLIRDDIEKSKSDVLETVKTHIEEAKLEVIEHVDKQLSDVKVEVAELKERLNAKDDELQASKKYIDREMMSRNIIFFQVPENESGSRELKFKIIKMINENFDVDITNYFDKAIRIGRKNESKVRPIRLSLTSFDKKMEIFWKKKQCESNVEMAEDFSPEILEKRRKLVPVLKKLKELKYSNVILRQDKLYVDGNLCEEEKWTRLIEDATISNVPMNEHTEKQGNSSVSGVIKRSRDVTENSPIRSSKQSKETEKSTPSKTTIVGINNRTNVIPSKNPIKEALRRQLQQVPKAT